MIPHVLDLKKEDFEIKIGDDLFFGRTSVLCRKNVPLMRMGCRLDEVDIFVAGGEETEDGKEPFMMIVQDHMYQDCYTYGSWATLEDFNSWFENPVKLY